MFEGWAGIGDLVLRLVLAVVLGGLLGIERQIHGRWAGLRARPTFFGLLAGTAIAVGGVWLGFARVGGIHIGVLSLLVNLCIAVGGSLVARRGLESRQAPS